MRCIALATVFLAGSVLAGEACDISCKIEKGLKGDGDAALEVAQESKRSQSHEIVVEWYRIAAENGNAVGQFEFANLLVAESRSSYDCVRAAYWYQQARRNGHPLAESSLLRLQAVLSKEGPSVGQCFDSG
jgi:TPR repeat protein